MELFIRQIINGLSTGSIYALIAVGYTMVYGIIKLINFAHGEVMMFGAYFAFLFAYSFNIFDLPFIVIVLLSMSFAALMGILIERLAYKKLRKAPRISALITAIGMSLFLQNFALLIWGSNKRKMEPLVSIEPVSIFGFEFSRLTLVTIGLSVGFMIILRIFIHTTKPGKAMRAVSQDKEAAQLMGINVNTIISLTFAIGSAMGALGGIFYAMTYGQVYPTMGVMPGLKAFIAAVFGGIGNITGAMIGGYLIGIIENLTKAYTTGEWTDAIAFALLIIILLFKPTGILGKNRKEKV